MDELLLLLTNYIIIGVLVSLATSTLISIFKPIRDFSKYSLMVAAVISTLIITAYNQGILTTLEVPQDFSLQLYFKYVDIGLTSIIFTLGAQAVHKLAEGINYYRDAKNLTEGDVTSQTTITTETDTVQEINKDNM